MERGGVEKLAGVGEKVRGFILYVYVYIFL